MALTTALAAGESDGLPTRFVAEGRESAARLYALLGQCHQLLAGSSTLHGPVGLAEQIFHCFDSALAKLHGVAGAEEGDVASAGSGRKRKPERGSAAATSKRIKASGGGGNGGRVERKATMDDNFLWRKYGQKEIKNSKHPRFYYRCSYKDDHGCKATKQVQQSEADPSIYVITYFSQHTCRHGNDAAAAAVVDGGGDEESSPAKFVISFGSTSSGSANSVISCPCAGDDAQMNSETSHESSLLSSEAGEEEEELRPCTVSDHGELVEESTTPPMPDQPLGLTAFPDDLEPLQEAYLLDMELGGESSFGIDEIFNFDELLFYSIDTAW